VGVRRERKEKKKEKKKKQYMNNNRMMRIMIYSAVNSKVKIEGNKKIYK